MENTLAASAMHCRMDTMDFLKYSHIENTSDIAPLGKHFTAYPALEKEVWVACEKVDGANFQFCTDGKEIVCCSRNRILKPSDEFFGYQIVLEKYKENVFRVYAKIQEKYGKGNRDFVVRIYGELFGGYYVKPPDVPNAELDGAAAGVGVNTGIQDSIEESFTAEEKELEGTTLQCAATHAYGEGYYIKPVQKRASYTPNLDYYLFDIMYDDIWLSMADIMEIASECGFPLYAKPLHQGTITELKALSPEYLTTIPEQLGLPQLPGNFSEGYILRPLNTPTMYKLKLKHKSFFETGTCIPKSIRDLTRPKRARPGKKKAKVVPEINLDEHEALLVPEVLAGITRNRLASVMSKEEGQELRRMDDRHLASLLVNDALDEILSDRHDLEEVVLGLDNASIRKIRSAVFVDALSFVGDNRTSM